MLCGVEKEGLDMLSVFALNGAKGAVAFLKAEFLNFAPRGKESRTVAAPNGSADFFAVDAGCHVDYFLLITLRLSQSKSLSLRCLI